MVQLAMRIMPAVIVAIILGTVGAAAVFRAVMDAMVGMTPINIPMIIRCNYHYDTVLLRLCVCRCRQDKEDLCNRAYDRIKREE